MAKDHRDSIRILKETIRRKRIHMGLPPEGQVDMRTFIAALQEQPPMEELVTYVKNALKQDPRPIHPTPPLGATRKPFDRKS